MPEIKRTFTAGKMNKDLDERLVRNGEYRDALNIQVRTTDGDSSGVGDAGTVQNIEGNVSVGFAYSIVGYDGNATKIIGNVNDEKNDKAYFFAAAPTPESGIVDIAVSDIIEDGERVWVDSIIEVDTSSNPTPQLLPEQDPGQAIFVDRFAVTQTWEEVGSPNPSDGVSTYQSFSVTDASKYRIGMRVYAQRESGAHLLFEDEDQTIPGVEIINIVGNTLYLASEQIVTIQTAFDISIAPNFPTCKVMKFVHPERVLEFDYNKILSGINIIDNLLFWTDAKTGDDRKIYGNEPKKINIDRSRAGTTAWDMQTQLIVSDASNNNELVPITQVENITNADVKLEHITVIRKKPISPPTLSLRDTERAGSAEFYITSGLNFSQGGTLAVPGETVIVTLPEDNLDIRENDVLTFTTSGVVTLINSTYYQTPIKIKTRVTDTNVDGNPLLIEVTLITVHPDLTLNELGPWLVTLKQPKPLFETKFGRFAYRYKYEDGEYSAFSPWSELAFLPGDFLYLPSKGYNKGMVNNLRELIIRDFIPDDTIRPSDVKTVDILWKTTDNANVYVIKSITREVNSEWELFTDNNLDNTGSITITSEIIERAIPSNQILRGWDNVPRTAVAQEVTGSRLIYGNYIQGYDISTPVGLKQSILNNEVLDLQGTKSVKSLRNYKWGMVFGDKYGRETPVISSGYLTGALAEGDTVTGDISLPKELAQYANRFKLLQTWEDNGAEPEEWMEYVKYYVKETSAEYYNLVMDRWYDAEDGNIWLSFPSVDRNKIDDETYLILKNQHGSQEPVLDEARYRVIAIENEAPDYIKTDRRKFDRITINMSDVYDTNVTSPESTNPNKLIDTTTISLPNSQVEFDFGSVKESDFKGTKKVRIVARYQPGGDTGVVYRVEGPIRTVTKIQYDPVPFDGIDYEDPQGIVIDKPFTASEVNMYYKLLAELSNSLSSTLTANVATIDSENTTYEIKYQLQFEDWVVENKPQFDGRFFAKVEVDNILRSNLLNEADGGYISDGVFDLAYIANKANNPAVSGTFANKAWGLDADDVAVDSVFTSSNVESSFGDDGNANTVLTEAFWNWWGDAESGVGTSKIFIDETPVASDYGFSLLPTTISQVYDPTAQEIVTFNFQEALLAAGVTGDTMINELQPGITQPSGFYAGVNYDTDNTELNENGTITHFTISTLGQTFESGQNAIFKNKMQTDGQLFRFPNDPNGHIYRVKRPTLITGDIDLDSLNDAFGNNEGGNDLIFGAWNADIGITVGEFNFDNLSNINYITNDNTDNYFSKRSSFIVRFTRVDPDTNGDNQFGEGIIDLDEFDPRGQVAHNGIGTFPIEFIKKESEVALLEDDVVTNNACWETEPKKDIDVDIYYEATGGIPMKLDTLGNTQVYTGAANFRPRASKVVFDRRLLLDGSSETIILTGVPFARKVYPNSTVSIWESGQNNTDVLLTPTITTATAKAVGIGINDEIAFKHKNGLVTRAKVVDHMEVYNVLTSLFDPNVPTQPSERITVNSGNATTLILQGGETAGGVLFQGDDQDLITTDLIGYNILPDVGINNGTFVTGVVDQGYGMEITINKPVQSGYTGSFTFVKVTGYYRLDVDAWKYAIDPNWFNCYSFGNGVESDRIRDDFNAPQIDNGFRASSKFLEYGEEHIGSGIIHSGLYNAISSVNSLNEFNMAEKITKNLNPAYGSIQAFKTRDTNLLTFCEDKVLTVLSNKDAVFNADGNPQLVATNRVLGTATPFIGDYGISKNPESLASDQYRAYFTDKQRGAVLRLSNDGLTPISSVGMTTYFRENLRLCNDLIGSFDMVNGEYNLTLDIKPENVSATTSKTTISFNEGSKGWVSFKSFIPSCGGSVSGKYLTAQKNGVWEHYANSTRNNFYGSQYSSTIDILFNDIPDSVKSFKAINYEGSQSKIDESHDIANETVEDASGNIISSFDGEYYNLSQKAGWYVTGFNTDLQEGQVNEFISKENKWFNYINGVETTSSNIDTSEFSVQGIGFPSSSLYSSGENSDSDLVIQEEPDDTDNADNEEDTSLSWEWQPLTLLNVYGNGIINNGISGIYMEINYAISGGIPPYSYVLEGSPSYTVPESFNITFDSPQTGTFTYSGGITTETGAIPQANVSIEVPEGTYTITISDSQENTIVIGPNSFNNAD